MVAATRAHRTIALASSVAVAIALVLGIVLRLDDPLSSPVIPAEDPYNHMALVREHLADGRLDPLNPEGTLYPPGFHAYLAAAWVFSGVDLYELVRLGPVLLGAIGLVGIAVLLWRTHGPVAAAIGTLVAAVSPEAVFRTTMMAPTALDLAVLPFVLLALLETARGRLAWAVPAAVGLVFLAYAHPWVVILIGLVGAGFVLLGAVLPWPRARGPSVAPRGVAVASVLLGATLALVLSDCLGVCGGNPNTLPGQALQARFAPWILAASLVPGALVLFAPRSLAWIGRAGPEVRATTFRYATAALLAAGLLAATAAAYDQGLAYGVDPAKWFGWAALIAGVVALVVLPFHPGPASHLGAALILVTYPFVFFDPLHVWFLSHRTGVYLGLGLFLLLGSFAGAVVDWAAGVAARTQYAPAPAPLRVPRGAPLRGPRPQRALVPVLLIGLMFAGTVAAAPEPEPWYRLFNECEADALRTAADAAAREPGAVVITGDWRAKLVVAAQTTNASRVWFKADFFDPARASERDGLVKWLEDSERPLLVVDDVYIEQANPRADTSFLRRDPFDPLTDPCTRPGVPGSSLVVYQTPGGLAP